MPIQEAIFRIDLSAPPMKLHDCINDKLQHLFAILQLNPFVTEVETQLNLDEPLFAEIEGQLYRIIRMTVPIRLWQDFITTRVLFSAYREPNSVETLALSGICSVELKHQKIKKILILVRKDHSDGGLQMKLHFLDGENKPTEILAGSSFALYGVKEKSIKSTS